MIVFYYVYSTHGCSGVFTSAQYVKANQNIFLIHLTIVKTITEQRIQNTVFPARLHVIVRGGVLNLFTATY